MIILYRGCYYNLAWVNKLVRSISVIIDPSIKGGEYRYHLIGHVRLRYIEQSLIVVSFICAH
jgi:hypothetical protein